MKKLSIKEAVKHEPLKTFEDADKQEQEYQELKSITTEQKQAGRPIQGKSKATHKIYFVVNDEQLEYLENLTNRKERTPSAIAKKLFISNFELYSKK